MRRVFLALLAGVACVGAGTAPGASVVVRSRVRGVTAIAATEGVAAKAATANGATAAALSAAAAKAKAKAGDHATVAVSVGAKHDDDDDGDGDGDGDHDADQDGEHGDGDNSDDHEDRREDAEDAAEDREDEAEEGEDRAEEGEEEDRHDAEDKGDHDHEGDHDGDDDHDGEGDVNDDEVDNDDHDGGDAENDEADIEDEHLEDERDGDEHTEEDDHEGESVHDEEDGGAHDDEEGDNGEVTEDTNAEESHEENDNDGEDGHNDEDGADEATDGEKSDEADEARAVDDEHEDEDGDKGGSNGDGDSKKEEGDGEATEEKETKTTTTTTTTTTAATTGGNAAAVSQKKAAAKVYRSALSSKCQVCRMVVMNAVRRNETHLVEPCRGHAKTMFPACDAFMTENRDRVLKAVDPNVICEAMGSCTHDESELATRADKERRMIAGVKNGKLKMESGTMVFSALSPTVSHMRDGTGPRETRKRVAYPTPFTYAPFVHLALSELDAQPYDNVRVKVVAENVDRYGFDVKVTTWGKTKLDSVGVEWLAYGKAYATRGLVRSGRLHAANPRSFNKRVAFPVRFSGTPEVAIALSGIDAVTGRAVRASIRATEITPVSFVARFHTWDGAVVRWVSASWVATDPGATTTRSGVAKMVAAKDAGFKRFWTPPLGPRTFTRRISFAPLVKVCTGAPAVTVPPAAANNDNKGVGGSRAANAIPSAVKKPTAFDRHDAAEDGKDAGAKKNVFDRDDAREVAGANHDEADSETEAQPDLHRDGDAENPNAASHRAKKHDDADAESGDEAKDEAEAAHDLEKGNEHGDLLVLREELDLLVGERPGDVLLQFNDGGDGGDGDGDGDHGDGGGGGDHDEKDGDGEQDGPGNNDDEHKGEDDEERDEGDEGDKPEGGEEHADEEGGEENHKDGGGDHSEDGQNEADAPAAAGSGSTAGAAASSPSSTSTAASTAASTSTATTTTTASTSTAGRTCKMVRQSHGVKFVGAPGIRLELAKVNFAPNVAEQVQLKARDVTTDGFTLEVRTWGASRMSELNVQWMAHMRPVEWDSRTAAQAEGAGATAAVAAAAKGANSASNPARSCRDIKLKAPASTDDVYWINVGGNPVQVFCNMKDGGWTRVVNIVGSSYAHANTDNAQEVENIKDAAVPAKFSDADINSIKTLGYFRFTCGTSYDSFVTNSEKTWTSKLNNSYMWLTSRDRNPDSFSCKASLEGAVFSEKLSTDPKCRAGYTMYAANNEDVGRGCYVDGAGWGQSGALWVM